MNEKQKKEYVKNSLKLDSGKRISEVVLRYFQSIHSAKNLKKESIMEVAEKLFS